MDVQYLQGVWEAGLAKTVAHVGALFVKHESRCANSYRKFFAQHVCLYFFVLVDVSKVLDVNRIAKKVKQFLFFSVIRDIVIDNTKVDSLNICKYST